MMQILTKMVGPTWKLLQINIDRYLQVPIVASAMPGDKYSVAGWQRISEIFPTFALVAAAQLKSQSNYVDIGQQLLIGAIGSVATQYPKQQIHTELFLKNVNPEIDLTQEQSGSADEKTYLPRLVLGDLLLITARLNLKTSTDRNEIIEHYYCMQGISQLFLRYYFDLLVEAREDKVSQHIDNIFFNFFANFHLKEQQYWKGYANSDRLKAQLMDIVEKNLPATRHPVLRNHCFEQLQSLHPIIHNGGSRKMRASTKNLLEKQLFDFQQFSLTQIALWLRAVGLLKDSAYLRYLVVQLAKSAPKKLIALMEFYQSTPDANFASEALMEVITPIAHQIAPPKPTGPPKTQIVGDETTVRLKKAKEKLANRKPGTAYTSDQMGDYFKKYLEKLYASVKKEGAMTQDDIAAHLARFQQKFVEIAQKEIITQKEKEEFEESIDDTFQTLTTSLPKEDAGEYQEAIQEEMHDLENVTIEERAQKVETIGQVVAAAAEMSDRVQEADESNELYQQALALEIQIGENPKHVTSIENFLAQPIVLEEKNKFLLHYVPDHLSIEMHKVVEEVQFRCGRSSGNPITIFKGNTLLEKTLIRQLFPQHPFKEILQKEIVPILPEVGKPRITVRDFFTFPFAQKKKGPPEEEWFSQHYFYLEMARNEGELSEEDHQMLVENEENFSKLKYKKFFNIVRKKKFEDTTFMAVYSLWKTNGIDKFRIE
ncbi:MAG: hypothetical protein HQM14_01000 [SAR324 cluster bacterium]|nr:hypothetical protein [SAR324 cluster bacterium]